MGNSAPGEAPAGSARLGEETAAVPPALPVLPLPWERPGEEEPQTARGLLGPPEGRWSGAKGWRRSSRSTEAWLGEGVFNTHLEAWIVAPA